MSKEIQPHQRKKRGDNVDGAGEDEKMLQTKFEIKDMYDEIYKLKRENEELWQIWERVRWTGPTR